MPGAGLIFHAEHAGLMQLQTKIETMVLKKLNMFTNFITIAGCIYTVYFTDTANKLVTLLHP